MLAALAVAALLQVPLHLEIANGAFRDGHIYWGVFDTYIRSRDDSSTHEGELSLSGGSDSVVLVRFEGLRSYLGGRKIVRKASLVLSPKTGTPDLLSAQSLLKDWSTGPIKPLTPSRHVVAGWPATWKERRSGDKPIPWQGPGASGFEDSSAIQGAHLESREDSDIEIQGLAQWAQAALDRPNENFGLVLRFKSPVEFDSSESGRGPRLHIEVEDAPTTTGPDLAVRQITADSGPGDSVTYTAEVTNIGDQPTRGCAYAWTNDDGSGEKGVLTGALAPGESVAVKLSAQRPEQVPDHRLNPIRFAVEPSLDSDPANNSLTIQQLALPLVLHLAPQFESPKTQQRLQAAVLDINRRIFPLSRFSFAPDGVLETLRIQSFTGDGDGLKLEISSESDLTAEGLLKLILPALGLPNLRAMAPRAEDVLLNDSGGQPVHRGGEDLNPGISGGGSTLNDAPLPNLLPLSYDGYVDPAQKGLALEAPPLLSATAVAMLNERASGARGDLLKELPETVILQATNYAEQALANTELSFYRLQDGKIANDSPSFMLQTSDGGTAPLAVKDESVFGNLKVDGSDGAFLVKAEANGSAEYTWLKVWQVVDAFHRSGSAALIMSLHFNTPLAPLDPTAQFAVSKPVSSSLQLSPEELVRLTDTKLDEPVSAEMKLGDWIEVDLNRDRPIGEIRFFCSKMPQNFEIRAYSTGQEPKDAMLWSQEANFAWSLANRSDLQPGHSIAYRSAMRVRYLRIVAKAPGEMAISEIAVTGLKPT